MTGGLFGSVRDRVLARHPGDEEGRMLRAPALKTAGKVYAFAAGTDVVVKLPASRVADLIDSGGGAPCSPRPGRPMKEWVRLVEPDEETCCSVVLEARSFVARSGG